MSGALWPLGAAPLALLLLALGGLLWPLLRDDGPAQDPRALRELYRSKRRELEREALDEAQRQQALDELALALLQDLDAAPPPTARPDRPWQRRLPAALLSVVLPVAAVALYLQAGDPRAAVALAQAKPAVHAGAGDSVEAAVARLAERLRANPDDLEGWLVLARSQETMAHFDAAARSYREAVAAAARLQAPHDIRAQLQAQLADALASARQGDLDGPAQAAIDAALALDADQPKALALAAAAALRRGDADGARRHWQRLLGLLTPGSEMALRVESDLQRLAAGSAPTPSAAASAIRARVTVDPAQAGRVPPRATVFVIVRPVGQRQPVAVLRLSAAELPVDALIDDRHAMSPDRPPSRAGAVEVQARLSPSGQALAQAEDWLSPARPARPGGVAVPLTLTPPMRQ